MSSRKKRTRKTVKNSLAATQRRYAAMANKLTDMHAALTAMWKDARDEPDFRLVLTDAAEQIDLLRWRARLIGNHSPAYRERLRRRVAAVEDHINAGTLVGDVDVRRHARGISNRKQRGKRHDYR